MKEADESLHQNQRFNFQKAKYNKELHTESVCSNIDRQTLNKEQELNTQMIMGYDR
jgi:hypothetical protein